jgi:hypothetical protein
MWTLIAVHAQMRRGGIQLVTEVAGIQGCDRKLEYATVDSPMRSSNMSDPHGSVLKNATRTLLSVHVIYIALADNSRLIFPDSRFRAFPGLKIETWGTRHPAIKPRSFKVRRSVWLVIRRQLTLERPTAIVFRDGYEQFVFARL